MSQDFADVVFKIREKVERDPSSWRVSPLDGSNMCIPHEATITKEMMEFAKQIDVARKLRKKWLFDKTALVSEGGYVGYDANKASIATDWFFGDDGVFRVAGCPAPGDGSDLREFMDDYHKLVEILNAGAVRTNAHTRLSLLETQFDRYVTLFGTEEANESAGDGVDMFGMNMVDTHIHAAACFSARVFCKFVRDKLRDHGDDVVECNVDKKTGVKTTRTLKEVCDSANIHAENINADFFGFLADGAEFQRFDNFNALYNPAGVAALRTCFLKTNNYMDGQYFAEIIKNEFDGRLKDCDCESTPAKTELRLSIYGCKISEWKELAHWVEKWFTNPEYKSVNKWMIQIPRIFRIFRKSGAVANFKELLRNIFEPMFQATLYPEENPTLTKFLTEVGGFDSVDDESLLDKATYNLLPPGQFDMAESPSYEYQIFHLYVNLHVLNQLRHSRGMNTFSMRPHCGESGSVYHLASAYLTSQSINHGINLKGNAPMQYLYYLDQVGCAVSPTSNNFLFVKYKNNPFGTLFRRGLNLSLSTDDPTFFHFTDESLMEEYSICRNVFSLSLTDLAEIARNSVTMSDFDDELKTKWLGQNYETTNNPDKTNVPPMRHAWRKQVLNAEKHFLEMVRNEVVDERKSAGADSGGAMQNKVMAGMIGLETDVLLDKVLHKMKSFKKQATKSSDKLGNGNGQMVRELSSTGAAKVTVKGGVQE